MTKVVEKISTHVAVNAALLRRDPMARDPHDSGSRPSHGAAHRKWRKRRASGRA